MNEQLFINVTRFVKILVPCCSAFAAMIPAQALLAGSSISEPQEISDLLDLVINNDYLCALKCQV